MSRDLKVDCYRVNFYCRITYELMSGIREPEAMLEVRMMVRGPGQWGNTKINFEIHEALFDVYYPERREG